MDKFDLAAVDFDTERRVKRAQMLAAGIRERLSSSRIGKALEFVLWNGAYWL